MQFLRNYKIVIFFHSNNEISDLHVCIFIKIVTMYETMSCVLYLYAAYRCCAVCACMHIADCNHLQMLCAAAMLFAAVDCIGYSVRPWNSQSRGMCLLESRIHCLSLDVQITTCASSASGGCWRLYAIRILTVFNA